MRLEPNEEAELVTNDLVRFGPWVFRVVIGDGEADETGKAEDVAADLEGSVEVPSSRGTLATRSSIFLRLRADSTSDREASWNEFYDRYHRLILGFARRAGMGVSEAEDILQEVMLGFFRVSRSFQYDPSKGRFRGYLKRVTLNAIRHQASRRTPGQMSPLFDAIDDSARMDSIWRDQWTRSVLRRALEEAADRGHDPKSWEAFELYGRRGIPVEEVGRRLEMTPEAVRQAKSRVARAVREIIERIRAAEG